MTVQYFATNLDENGQPRWVNRRGFVRYQCALATAGKIFPDQQQEFHQGWVLDVSKGGAGLFLAKPLPDGLVVTLQINAANSDGKFELKARVVNSRKQVSGEWLVGFSFDSPLTDEQLDNLL